MTMEFLNTAVLGQNGRSVREPIGPHLMKYLALPAALLVLYCGVSRAGVEAGSAAYARGDYPAAFKEFQIGADRGDAVGEYWLGWLYANGRGVARSERRAALWYRKAAAQGYAGAQYDLGVLYANGSGVDQDYREALSWYLRAAAQGYAPAQFNLGYLYSAKGLGVAQDDAQSLRWYRRAAEQGFGPAQNELGWMYFSGQGVARDFMQAKLWYGKAAQQSFAPAQYNLGLMYFEGRGVAADPVAAYRWFLAAAAGGSQKAGERMKQLEPLLSAAQIAQARAMAGESADGPGVKK